MAFSLSNRLKTILASALGVIILIVFAAVIFPNWPSTLSSPRSSWPTEAIPPAGANLLIEIDVSNLQIGLNNENSSIKDASISCLRAHFSSYSLLEQVKILGGLERSTEWCRGLTRNRFVWLNPGVDTNTAGKAWLWFKTSPSPHDVNLNTHAPPHIVITLPGDRFSSLEGLPPTIIAPDYWRVR